MAILPARPAVLDYMNTVDEADVYQVMEALKNVYGKEKHFTVPIFLEHLMSLECNGYLVQTGYGLNTDGNLSIRYQINEDGKQAVQKYIVK